MKQEHGSFCKFLWPFGRASTNISSMVFSRSFVKGRPKVNRWKSMKKIPVVTKEAKEMSRELKRRGFRFVGPTICYALMQSVGMVNDHPVSTWQWKRVNRLVTERFGTGGTRFRGARHVAAAA